MKNIFITGATGFLGSLLIDEILSSSDDVVHTLVRGDSESDARSRLMKILNEALGEAEVKKISGRIKIYVGDITDKNLGLDRNLMSRLIDDIDVIYHTAASTDLNVPLKKIRHINVDGTRNLLDLAASCVERGRLKKVNHISTCYIVGTKRCVFKESDLDVGQSFNNTYEQSKCEAEKLVQEYRQRGLDIDVFRPSIVLGRYKDGMTTNFKMFYQPLHFFSMGLFERIPAAKDSMANLINVDIAVKAVHLIASSSKTKNMTYQIASPKSPRLEFVLDVASDYFGFDKLELVPLEKFNMDKEYSVTKKKMITPYIPYFNYFTSFDVRNTLNALKGHKFAFPEFDEVSFTKLYEYCVKAGFIKRKASHVVAG